MNISRMAKPMEQIICSVCGRIRIIEKWKYDKNRGKVFYCSPECFQSKAKVKCLECGEEFVVHRCYVKQRKYCSRKCANVARGRSFTGEKNPAWKDGRSLKVGHGETRIHE